MSYITLETGFYRHPKVLALGNTALARTSRDLYVGALMYSREHLTDGFVPLHALSDIDPITSHKDVERAALALHSVGLFQRKRGRFTGYWVKDYGKHQQTKAEVEAAKDAARERKRKERERKAAPPLSHSDTLAGHGVTHSDVTDIEVEGEVEEERSRALQELDAGFSDFDERDIEVDAILKLCGDANDESKRVVSFYARQVSLGSVVKVRESCKKKRGCEVRYAVGALKSEAKEAA